MSNATYARAWPAAGGNQGVRIQSADFCCFGHHTRLGAHPIACCQSVCAHFSVITYAAPTFAVVHEHVTCACHQGLYSRPSFSSVSTRGEHVDIDRRTYVAHGVDSDAAHIHADFVALILSRLERLL